MGLDYQVTAPVVVSNLPGLQRVEGAAAVAVGGSRDIVVVGGTRLANSTSCSGRTMDTMVLRFDVRSRTSGVGTGSISLTSTNSFESPTTVSPPLQLDDWADSVAFAGPDIVVVGTQTRQFDCVAGGEAYFGPGSVQLVRYRPQVNAIDWAQRRGLQNFAGRAVAVAVSGTNGFENYHLFAGSSAWKFDSEGAQVFAETVAAGPIVGLTSVTYGWFGDVGVNEIQAIR